jgi:hypothetical protein
MKKETASACCRGSVVAAHLVALQRDRPKFILVQLDRELAQTAPAPCAGRSQLADARASPSTPASWRIA